MLTADEAAKIAHRHGLTLADAASLRALADTVEEAEAIASNFAPDDDPKQFVRNLFERAEQARRPKRATVHLPEPKDDQ